jgi:hypothetical protein
MVKTRDLFKYIREHRQSLPVKTNTHDGTEFLVVWVADLPSEGYQLWEEPSRAQQALDRDHEEQDEQERENPRMMLCPNCYERAVMSNWGWRPDCGEYF